MMRENIEGKGDLNEAQFSETVRILKERIDYVENGGILIPAEEVFDKLSRITGVRFDD